MDRKKEDFELLFRMECRQHGIGDTQLAWIEEDEEILAQAIPWDKVIEFTSECLRLSWDTIIWIIRHEIAHVLDYLHLEEWYEDESLYHGESWKRWCKVVGCPATERIPAR